MVNLAPLPSRTSVTIKSDVTGADAVIQAATEQQAGVMTAEMVKALNRLVQSVLQSEPQATVVHFPVPSAPIPDLSLPAPQEPQTQVLPPTSLEQIIARLTALEQRSTSNADYASLVNTLTAFRDHVGKRITAIEQRLAKLETNDNAALPHAGVNNDVAALRAEIADLRLIANENQQFIGLIKDMVDDPTPVLMPETTDG